MSKRRGLGRGLDALLGDPVNELSTGEEGVAGENKQAPQNDLRDLPVDVIRPGKYQPRSDIREDSLQELADSIKAQGVVQPIVVRPIGNDEYEIIAGERRWRASQLAGMHEVPAVIREVPDEAAIAMALIENIQREDLNPLEEALALNRLIKEFELTHQEAADAVGRSRAAVSNLLRLLDLAPAAKKLLEERKLDMGHARALLSLPDDRQGEAAKQVSLMGLSVRETEQLVKKLLAHSSPKTDELASVDEHPDVKRLRAELSDHLGAVVDIKQQASGKGKLVVSYTNLDELQGILERIQRNRTD